MKLGPESSLRMPVDNPFFIRELRQHGRRRSGVLARLLSGLLLWALIVAVSLVAGPLLPGHEPGLWGRARYYAGALAAIHSGCCVAAGLYGAELALAREIRRRTLLELRLLDLPPGRMLALKLAFPFWLIGVVWSAGVPLALIAVVLGAMHYSGAVRGLLFAAWCGQAALWVGLLFPGGHSMETRYLERHGRASWKWPSCAVLSSATAGLLMMATLAAWNAADRWPFFGYRINAWIACGVMLSLVSAAAILSTQEQFAGKEAEQGKLDSLLVLGVPLTLVIGVGGIWQGMPAWLRWVAAAVIGLVSLGLLLNLKPEPDLKETRAKAQTRAELKELLAKAEPTIAARRESQWLQAELNWLESRWSNPLFLRDLRASCRTGSLRKRARNQVVSGLLQVGFLSLLLKPFGSVLFGVVGRAYIDPLFRAGSTAATHWEKEQSSGTRALLLATPLSERELLLGRLLASFVRALPELAFPTLVLWSGAIWVAVTRYWPIIPMLLALLPVLLRIWIISGCRRAFPSGEQLAVKRNRFLLILVNLELLLVPGGFYALHLWRGKGPAFCYALAALLALLHFGFALLLFRGYERKLRAYRRTDVDLAAV